MEAHWGKKNGRTRIFYLNFGTSAGNSVSGGTKTDLKGSITAPEGYQLGGFFGRDGDEIDLLGVVWTSIEAVAESASTSGGASTDEDIVLSPVHGGPHGVAFSDVRSIVLGQTLGSVTLRGDRRVDAVTLQVATPAEQTWKETTLALGPGEYINSVEFHWGKKDGRTRVFYVNFGTSAGNSLSAGTKTEETATETAPEGFQLSGLHGRAENEVDQLGCIWTRIDAKPALLTDVVDTAWFGDIIRNWGAKLLYMCAANVINVIKQLIYYFRYVQTTAPQGDTENMLAVSYQSNVVLLVFAGYVVTIVENIVKQVIVNGDEIISSAKNVVDLLKNSSAANNSASSVTELEDFIAANTSCGFELKQLTDRVLVTVNDLRNKTPDAAVNDVRVAVSKSSLWGPSQFMRRERVVYGISLTVTRPTAMALRHGKRAGNTSELVLGAKEYITSMEAHWGTVLRRTQIVYLRFNTSEGNSISGFQLGGFFGLSDKTIVKMGAIWTRISTKVSATATSIKLAASASSDASESSSAAVSDESSASELLSFSESASVSASNAASASESGSGAFESQSTDLSASASTDVVAVSTGGSASPTTSSLVASVDNSAAGSAGAPVAVQGPIQLSESFGGPHGKKFSDQASVVAGQTIGSITIRAGERVDGISLEVTGPTAVTFNHGRAAGKKNTLTLAKDEYITSMEAHWAEKKGNTVSGGSQTESKNTVTAPEGFQLGGFFGQDGDKIDKLGAIWTRISAEDPATEAPASAASSSGSGVPFMAGSAADSAPASADSSGSTDSLPKKKKKKAVAASSEGSAVGSAEDSTLASADASGSAEAPIKTKKKAAAAVPTKKKKAAAVASSEGSDVGPTKKKKAAAVASSEGSDVGFTEDSALASGDASGSAAAPTKKKKEAVGSTEDSAMTSTEGSTSSVAVQWQRQIPRLHLVWRSTRYNFSDQNFVNSGQTVSAISLHAGERLDGITLEISAPKTLTFTHGGTGGDQKTLKLEKGEYITSMEVHWSKHTAGTVITKDKTRIFYLNFATNLGNSLSGGTMTEQKTTVAAPKGFQLAGFFGSEGKGIDSLGAIWASIELVKPPPAPTPSPTPALESGGSMESSGSGNMTIFIPKNTQPVQLSESFGGPHGKQFSDQLAVSSGMTVTSVTIRAAERLDGITLEVSAPKKMTFTHGRSGGKEDTLVLKDGEYITSIEAHLGKKRGLRASSISVWERATGGSISGGTETEIKGSAEAPKGFQLAGFFGRFGDEIDLIGAVWASIAAVNETVSGPVSADEDIALSEFYGGPHGNAFSDISKIVLGHRWLLLRSRSRTFDAVTIQVVEPLGLTYNHGGPGGEEITLALDAAEYINSMEVHWCKNDGRTQRDGGTCLIDPVSSVASYGEEDRSIVAKSEFQSGAELVTLNSGAFLNGSYWLDQYDGDDKQKLQEKTNTLQLSGTDYAVPLAKEFPTIWSTEVSTLKKFQWAYSMVSSRAFKVASAQEPTMLPVIDMANHSAENPVAHIVKTDSGSFQLIALRKVEKDEPVTISYGDLSNAQLLCRYGFVLPTLVSSDSIHITSSELTNAFKRSRRIRRRRRRRGRQYPHVGKGKGKAKANPAKRRKLAHPKNDENALFFSLHGDAEQEFGLGDALLSFVMASNLPTEQLYDVLGAVLQEKDKRYSDLLAESSEDTSAEVNSIHLLCQHERQVCRRILLGLMSLEEGSDLATTKIKFPVVLRFY
ncbi:Jacalin-like lectin domain [Phytophthora cactorum]|nr:Jacalin-like lectin domain [Phytophthora cactorum]